MGTICVKGVEVRGKDEADSISEIEERKISKINMKSPKIEVLDDEPLIIVNHVNEKVESSSTLSLEYGGESTDSLESLEDFEFVELIVNKKKYMVKKGTLLIDVSNHKLPRDERIPTLCHHPFLPPTRLYKGKCGICEVKNKNGKFIRACKTHVDSGMEFITNSHEIEAKVRSILKEKLSSHPLSCPSCPSDDFCMFKDLLTRYEISIEDLSEEQRKIYNHIVAKDNKIVAKNNSLIFNDKHCLNCYACIRACEYISGMSKCSLLDSNKNDVKIFNDLEDFHTNMFNTDCIKCGQCSFVCPSAGIIENSCEKEVNNLFKNNRRIKEGQRKKTIVAIVAPSVRITIGEFFTNDSSKIINERKLVSALKELGFDYVFDVLIGSDLTTMEETKELQNRLKSGGPWPMFTSCCPGWVNLVEQSIPKLIPHLSTCKSPTMMVGNLLKNFWSKENFLKRSDVIVVAIMPCVAKKDEIMREQLLSDVDYVLTTREVGRMLKTKKIDLLTEKEVGFDILFGNSGGSTLRFGRSGGVMKSVVSLLHEEALGKPFTGRIKYEQLNEENDQIRKAKVKFGGIEVKLGVANTAKNIRILLDDIRNDRVQDVPYVVEMMACIEGCIGGGGNPKFNSNIDMIKERKKKLIMENKRNTMQPKSPKENPTVKFIYEKWLKDGPCGKLAKRFLHTSYSRKLIQ